MCYASCAILFSVCVFECVFVCYPSRIFMYNNCDFGIDWMRWIKWICLFVFCLFVYLSWIHFHLVTYNRRSRSSLSASLVNESVSVYSSRFRRQHGGLSSSSSSLQCSNSSLWCSSNMRLGKRVSHPLQLLSQMYRALRMVQRKFKKNRENMDKISTMLITYDNLLHC